MSITAISLDCLLCCCSRQRRSPPLETLDVTSFVLRRCGAEYGYLGVGTPRYPGMSMPWSQCFACHPNIMRLMIHHQEAIRAFTDSLLSTFYT